MILYHREDASKLVQALENRKSRICFVSSPELDNYGKVWNVNCPGYRYPDRKALTSLLGTVAGYTLILDGIYPEKDEEYLDVKILESL
jgi:hypothetical protein